MISKIYIGQAPVRVTFISTGDTDDILKRIGVAYAINSTIVGLRNTCVIIPRYDKCIRLTSDVTTTSRLYQTPKEMREAFEKDSEIDRSLRLMVLVFLHYNDIYNNVGIDVFTSTNSVPNSGLGGSASHVISQIIAYNRLNDIEMKPEDIARLAYEIERHKAGIGGGYQDQYSIAYGGFNFMTFEWNEKDKRVGVEVQPINLTENQLAELERRMLLIYIPRTGVDDGGQIHREIARRVESLDQNILVERRDLALEIKGCLESGNYDNLPRLMEIDWKLKVEVNPYATNECVENVRQTAFNAGAEAVRFSGAGGGGCALVYCRDNIDRVEAALRERGVRILPLRFERHKETGLWLPK